MSDPYAAVKGGKLKLKKDKKTKKASKRSAPGASAESQKDPDTERHGTWWTVSKFSDISGPIAIELADMRYLRYEVESGNDLAFCVGASTAIGEGPSDKEILLAVKMTDNKVAFKTAYDTYVSCGSDGVLLARAQAVGEREQWEPIFQDGQLALLNSANSKFLGCSPEDDDEVECRSDAASAGCRIKIRSCADRTEVDLTPMAERATIAQTEMNYARMYQGWHHQKFQVNTGTLKDVKKAKKEGDLHEVLLDRREKMKADRMCK